MSFEIMSFINYLCDHKSSLVFPVDVSIWVTCHFLTGLNERQHQRTFPRSFLYRQQAAGSVIRRPRPGQVRITVVFGFSKVLQNLAVTPAFVTHVAPPIVVVSISSHVQHIVQHTRPTQYFTARPIAPAVLQAQTRLA